MLLSNHPLHPGTQMSTLPKRSKRSRRRTNAAKRKSNGCRLQTTTQDSSCEWMKEWHEVERYSSWQFGRKDWSLSYNFAPAPEQVWRKLNEQNVMSSLNVIKHHALIPDLVGSLRSQLREKARLHQILWNGADQDLYRPPVGIHYCYQPDCLDGR
jgi:hypothetical protein